MFFQAMLPAFESSASIRNGVYSNMYLFNNANGVGLSLGYKPQMPRLLASHVDHPQPFAFWVMDFRLRLSQQDAVSPTPCKCSMKSVPQTAVQVVSEACVLHTHTSGMHTNLKISLHNTAWPT